MNKIILIGRLTQDVECQYSQNGTAYIKSAIAVQRDFKNANGEYDTDFINIVAYKTQAELIAKHFSKGDRIGIVGSLQIDKWQDQNGQNRYTPNVVVREIEFLQDKKEVAPTMTPPTEENFEISEDDLPF